MRYYAVIDTNVLISSLLTSKKDSATAKVVDSIAEQRLIPLYSEEIFEEYEEVLKRPKFPFSGERIESILEMIRQFGLIVHPSPTGEVLPDEDDLMFYEVVMEKRDDGAYLITGNIKHFPKRKNIVTPAEMMAIIENMSVRRTEGR